MKCPWCGKEVTTEEYGAHVEENHMDEIHKRKPERAPWVKLKPGIGEKLWAKGRILRASGVDSLQDLEEAIELMKKYGASKNLGDVIEIGMEASKYIGLLYRDLKPSRLVNFYLDTIYHDLVDAIKAASENDWIKAVENIHKARKDFAFISTSTYK